MPEKTVQEKYDLRQKALEKLEATIKHAEEMQASFQQLNDAEEMMTKNFKNIVPGGEISNSHANLKTSLEKNAAYIKDLHEMINVFNRADQA